MNRLAAGPHSSLSLSLSLCVGRCLVVDRDEPPRCGTSHGDLVLLAAAPLPVAHAHVFGSSPRDWPAPCMSYSLLTWSSLSPKYLAELIGADEKINRVRD